MAFRKKAEVILDYKPDILIVPECENPEKLKFRDQAVYPKNILWFGKNTNKGLGVFSYGDYRVRLTKSYAPELRLIVPIAVKNNFFDFTLFAIWANNPEDRDGQYVTQIWKAIKYYDKLLNKKPSILVGDFNSNAIWDKPKREGNHSDIVRVLEKKGIRSAYHEHFNQIQGEEAHSTLYMYKNKDRGYHIDYCFLSKEFASKLESVEIGNYDSWIRYSDHVPLIVTIKL